MRLFYATVRRVSGSLFRITGSLLHWNLL